MQNRRRSAAEITPLIEDRGLFKQEICQVAVSLVPIMWSNNRGDFCVKGLVRNDTVIELVIAGRRNPEAHALQQQLLQLQNQTTRQALSRKADAPLPENIRLPVTIEGAWRLRFQPDGDGWEVRSYQLLAARWAFLAKDGVSRHFGLPPEQMRQGGVG
ncbi:hypothetical protein RSK20926_03034 [Roseobacter sp. SK209-2-6]|uniref:hypothetical protein n=1 Tax=Roseobacter sp. SK209-2-6 TaxID=388739 RepID=UPI0000F3EE60|nr:hypothetical protein [Roseobacter sp. SK209-2-6]EBA16745.1 hypothetical protein RSK20926_03034 [Roseobacter sp. SK209-2-6]